MYVDGIGTGGKAYYEVIVADSPKTCTHDQWWAAEEYINGVKRFKTYQEAKKFAQHVANATGHPLTVIDRYGEWEEDYVKEI